MWTKKWFIIFLIAGFGLIFKGPGPMAADPKGDWIKALYLYNFLFFVDWPKQALGNGEPITLAVTGDDTLFATLFKMDEMSVKGRSLVIGSFASPRDLPLPCHVVFIGKKTWDLAAQIIERIGGRPVLTVSDMPGFAQMGGMVGFRHIAGHDHDSSIGHPKRFEINLRAVQGSGLGIRSRLLRLSDMVE
jgi:hypothetical protein